MNGAQDLGGMMGFGPVQPEAHEPVFHADWERRAFAITLASGSVPEKRTSTRPAPSNSRIAFSISACTPGN